MARGLFLSFEGIDGSGKSTQTRLLADMLRAEGRSVTLTREPGGSPGAEEIRSLVLEGAPERWSPETEILLFTAARRDHLERTIRPALAKGEVVISDRFADSTRVYQGMTRKDLIETVDLLHRQMIGVEPDITLLIDIDPDESLSRAVARTHSHTGAHAGEELRFEAMGVGMQIRMRQAYLDLAAKSPRRFRVIDGKGTPIEVAARVRAALG